MGVCGTRRSQLDPGLGGQLHDVGGGARRHRERDEVAAGRVRPRGEVLGPEFSGEDVVDRCELRVDELRVLPHVLADALGGAEEACVAEVADLVRSDRSCRRVACEPIHDGGGAAEERDTGAGMRDLRCGGEDQRPVRVSGLSSDPQDIDRFRVRLAQMVERIRVVPEHGEITCCGLQCHQLTGAALRDGDADRVRVDRHDPDALDGGIVGGKRCDLVHIGTFCVRGDRHQFEAQGLCEAEVTVIPRHRAQHAHGRSCPRARRIGTAVEHCEGERVPHEGEG